MKKTILLLAALVLLLAAAGGMYRYLSRQNAPEAPAPLATAATTAAPGDETAPEETEVPPESDPTPIPAPDFTVLSLEGETVSLSDYRGKPVVINFWATWCPPCRGELPAFQSAWERYGDKVQFLMVDLCDGQRETESIVRDFLRDNGYSFPVFLDTEYSGAESYGVSAIPMTILVDAEGGILGGQRGALEEETLLAAVAAMAGE